jgi:hypothetical protein
MLKRVYVLIIIFILVGLCGAKVLIKKVETQKIYEENFKYYRLSPKKDKLLIVLPDNKIKIIKLNTNNKIFSFSIRDIQNKIVYIDWYDNSSFMVIMKNNSSRMNQYYHTKDFIKFRLIDEVKLPEYDIFFNDNKYLIFHDDNTESIIIKNLNSNTAWNTGLHFKNTGFSCSSDGNYIFISDDNTNYLVDVTKSKIQKIDINEYDGYWAPSKNLYAFISDSNNSILEAGRLYIFNPIDLTFRKLNNNELYSSTELIWSPNSNLIMIIHGSELTCYKLYKDISNNQKSYPILTRKYEAIEGAYSSWTQNSKSFLFLSHASTENVFKPIDYFVGKINIKSGSFKKLYLDFVPGLNVNWVNENLIIHDIDQKQGLYMTKLRW